MGQALDTGPRLAATVIVLSLLAYPLLGLRVYIRLKTKAWGLDDWAMIIASVPFTALTVACLGGAFNGIGAHEAKLDTQQKEDGLHWFFFFEVFYCFAIIPIKLSISFMEMRIASTKKLYVISLWVVSAFFTIMNVISLFFIIFHCMPVSKAWASNTPGHCNPSSVLTNIYYADTAMNIVTDWFCAILPIPLLWGVQLNRNAKVSVVFLLSLGVFASLSACIRLKYTVNLNNGNDYLFGVGDIVIWGYAENGIGMIVGCMSTLRPLFRSVFHLGSSAPGPSSNMRSTRANNKSRRNYQNFEDGYELPEGMPKDSGMTVVKGGTVKETSIHDTDSEEHILSDYSGNGIKMTRSVLQETSYSGHSHAQGSDSPV